MTRLRDLLSNHDLRALMLLTALWVLFFWRLITPVALDQTSVKHSDFASQFVTFGAYQYERFASGQIPLWNPYNNGGLPFIGDPQAAVFYPPRLATITLSHLSGGWTYNSLQMEVILHVLVYTYFVYAFVRRLTIKHQASQWASTVAAIIAGYGGYLASYPVFQVALLEAGIWLPLCLLGVLEATRSDQIRFRWLVVAGFALGLSWLAGHPQTSWFATYLVTAHIVFRTSKHSLGSIILSIVIVAIVSFGVSAVQLLPGLEYLSHSMRTDFGFNAKSNGFPIQDILQFILPGVLTIWSPLFIGVSGLILVVMGTQGKGAERKFWVAVAIVAFTFSLGGNSVVFHALYNILPGLRYFRGQERAAYLVVNSLSILAAFGVIYWNELGGLSQRWIQGLASLFAACLTITIMTLVISLDTPETYSQLLTASTLSTGVVGAFILLSQADQWRNVLLVLLVTFELFTVNMDKDNYVSIPASDQAIMQEPELVQRVKADADIPYRVDGGLVDGRIGVYGNGNTGSLYQVEDIRGISPLFLDGPHAIIQRKLPSEVAWELFAVRYVFTDWEVLPVESELIGRDYPDDTILNLHRLSDPRPFAQLMFDYAVVDSDEFAQALLATPEFDARNTLILHEQPGFMVQDQPASNTDITIVEYTPESIQIIADTQANALLSLSLVDAPGWEASVNEQDIPMIRAYGGLSALPLPAGKHNIHLIYDPMSFKLGAAISLFTWLGISILLVLWLYRKSNASTPAK